MSFDTWVEKDLKKLKKINIFLSFIVLLVVSFLTFVICYAFWSIHLEEYCRKEAQNIVGDKWGILLDPNPDEYGFVPLGKGNKITFGFREQLKCERTMPIFASLAK